MKGSIEYKILRYLKDNDNGEYINVTNIIDDRKLLESKLHSLSKEPKKYISTMFPVFFFGIGLPNSKNDELKAKIEINGIILLDKIENCENNITNNNFGGDFEGNFIQSNNNKGNQSFEKTGHKKTNNKQVIKPIEKKSIWSKIISFLVKFWWLFVIPLIIELIKIILE
jgi:hypothetical protein